MEEYLTPNDLAGLADWDRKCPCFVIGKLSERTQRLVDEEYLEINDGIALMKQRGRGLLNRYAKALEVEP